MSLSEKRKLIHHKVEQAEETILDEVYSILKKVANISDKDLEEKIDANHLKKIEESIQDIQNGNVKSDEEVNKICKEWLAQFR